MKTIYFVRHAKSSWNHDVMDHQRPLNSKGKKDIIKVSEKVASQVKKPDLIISSDANRALTTAKQFKKAFDIPEDKFLANVKMYDFSGEGVMEIINAVDNDISTLMVFGHNNAFTHLVNILGDKYIEKVPTCGFVQIDFDTDNWKSLTNGTTVKTVFPRHLKK